MTTMLTAMLARSSSPLRTCGRWLIIGSALLALAACSAFRVAYDRGPTLAGVWLDRWLDLDRTQEAALQPALQAWFDWHRAQELPVYAERIARWHARAAGEVDADAVCALVDETRAWSRRALDAALPAATELLPALAEAQWAHLRARQAERLAKLRAERLQPDPSERRAAALERALEQAEDFYGRLDAAQRALLAESVARSPMDAARWLDERERQQADLVDSLRRAQTLEPRARRDALAALVASTFDATDPRQGWRRDWYRSGCETWARLHNSTTPAQRERLRQRLLSYEQDLSALAAAAAN
jgi:hypothetical protein